MPPSRVRTGSSKPPAAKRVRLADVSDEEHIGDLLRTVLREELRNLGDAQPIIGLSNAVGTLKVEVSELKCGYNNVDSRMRLIEKNLGDVQQTIKNLSDAFATLTAAAAAVPTQDGFEKAGELSQLPRGVGERQQPTDGEDEGGEGAEGDRGIGEMAQLGLMMQTTVQTTMQTELSALKTDIDVSLKSVDSSLNETVAAMGGLTTSSYETRQTVQAHGQRFTSMESTISELQNRIQDFERGGGTGLT